MSEDHKIEGGTSSAYLNDYWDARAKHYGVAAPGFGARTDYDKKHLECFDRNVKDCESLLDIGCGSGRLYSVLKKHCKKYTGVDFSSEMLDLFVKHREMREQDQVKQCDITCLPFPDQSFDAVTVSVVLQHLIDHERFLKAVAEIKRVLKIGGTLYLCEAMTQGALYCQPFPTYQRLRPRKMYVWVFYPEINLEEKETPYHTHHLLTGEREVLKERNKLILDLGSGRRKEYYTVGIDNRLVTRHGIVQTDVVSDALNIPYNDGSADEIHCCNLIEHFDNPYPLLLEISRVIKPDGLVVIEVPYAGTQSGCADPSHKFVLGPADWALTFSGFFGKVVCAPIGVRFQTSPKWKKWQEEMIKDGFHDFAQGGRYYCTQPLSIPEFRYIPWWLEDYVKGIAGEDMV